MDDTEAQKILIIAVDYKPNQGGVAEYIHSLADALHRQGENVIVLAPRLAGSQEHDASTPVEIRRFDFQYEKMKRLKRFWAAFAPVQQTIRNLQPDVVLFANYKTHWSVPWMLAAFIARTSYWTVAYGLEVSRKNLGWFARKKRACFFRFAKGVVAISSYTAEKLALLGVKRDKIAVIPCGVDPEFRLAIQGKEKQKHGNPNVILTVGRLVERKGHDMVIRALPQVLQSFPDTVYVIAGDGPDRRRLERLVQENRVANHVRFEGQVSEAEKWDLYGQCMVFCMPARELPNGDYEGFGIVYLEAALVERPIVAGRCGGAIDAVADGKTGFLVDPESPQEIATAIIHLLGDRMLSTQMGKEGRRRVMEQFTWERAARKILDVIEGYGGGVEDGRGTV